MLILDQLKVHTFLLLVILISTFACQSKKVPPKESATENKVSTERIVEIKENERGVLFKKFDGGVDTSKSFMPGKYTIAPSDRLTVYNIDSQSKKSKLMILSREGRSIEFDMEYTYKPVANKVQLLHAKIGEKYEEYIVTPEVRSAWRKYFGKIKAAKIKMSSKEAFEDDILRMAGGEIGKHYIELERIQIHNIIHPKKN